MQSPKDFVHFLIDEASENGGKISVAVAIMTKFPALAKMSIFSHLIKKIDSKNPAKTIANSTQLLKTLSACWKHQGQVGDYNLTFLFCRFVVLIKNLKLCC